MSDTDDTDNLLLIPPDFFSIHSDTEDSTKSYGPYYKVVDSLITQVSKLENRVNSISTASDTSFGNSLDNYQDNYKSTKLMSGSRKYSSLEHIPQEVYTKSAQTTPQKPKTQHQIHSLPSTPSTVRYSPRKSKPHARYDGRSNIPPRTEQNEMLNDIDSFISNVKTIQKFQAARNLSTQFSLADEDLPRASRLNLKEVDQMLETVELQQQDFESRLKAQESECSKQHTWQAGDSIHSVPNRGMGMRNFLYKDTEKNTYNQSNWRMGDSNDPNTDQAVGTRHLLHPEGKPPAFRTLTATSVLAQPDLTDSTRNTESLFSDISQSLSSDSTQTTAYQAKNENANKDANKIHSNASHVLNMHKKLLSRNTVSSTVNGDQPRSLLYSQRSNDSLDYEPTSKNALALLSLSELWNQAGDMQHADRSKFLNKLQEEKLRRQHCEQLIQKLQTRTLELQERLAVAIQVDGAKDEAISRIHKSWEDSATRIDELCSKNTALEHVVAELKNKFSQETSEAAQKVDYYEKESSKALNLAHNSQERLGLLEKENNTLSTQLQTFERQFNELHDNYNTQCENVQRISNLLSQKEAELNENKSILADARKEVGQSKRAVEMCQTELSSMRATQNDLERQLNNELERIKEIEKEKKRVLVDIDAHKKIEKSLQDELNKQKEKTEENKVELRNFYQEQVEVVVREKLREFQLQLEKAESSLHEELRSREFTVAKAAAAQIQQFTEKHAMEIHLLEEKHKEEVKLYNFQLSKAKQQIDKLQLKFQQHQERKSHIAQQLHKVMEAQWLEALKIINSKSPIIPQDKGTNTIDQLNSLKSKSYNNVEEILFKEECRHIENSDYKNITSPKIFSSTIDDESLPIDTPLTSRPQKTRQQLDQEMQKYIRMLLNKSPRNPSDEQNTKQREALPQSPDDPDDGSTNAQNQNNYDKTNNGDGLRLSKTGYRDRLGKPPWK